MNLKPVIRQKIRMLFISLLTALGFVYGIHKILTMTTSLNLSHNLHLIKVSWLTIKGNINRAINILEYLNKLGIPQSGYNAAIGAIGSISGNIVQLRRPRIRRAAMSGMITAAAGSMFTTRVSALSELKKIQRTMIRSETAAGAYFSKGTNLLKTAMGFQSQAQEVAALCAVLTRYIIKLSFSFGINISRDVIKKVRFLRSTNTEKRLELLSDSDVRKIASRVIQSVSVNSNNVNAASTLLSLSRNTR